MSPGAVCGGTESLCFWNGVQGKVANFVETEQLVELTAQGASKPAVVSSFVQVRGSIPLLWSQIPSIKYKPTTLVSPPSAYEPAFDNHINDLISSYQVSLWSMLFSMLFSPS